MLLRYLLLSLLSSLCRSYDLAPAARRLEEEASITDLQVDFNQLRKELLNDLPRPSSLENPVPPYENDPKRWYDEPDHDCPDCGIYGATSSRWGNPGQFTAAGPPEDEMCEQKWSTCGGVDDTSCGAGKVNEMSSIVKAMFKSQGKVKCNYVCEALYPSDKYLPQYTQGGSQALQACKVMQALSLEKDSSFLKQQGSKLFTEAKSVAGDVKGVASTVADHGKGVYDAVGDALDNSDCQDDGDRLYEAVRKVAGMFFQLPKGGCKKVKNLCSHILVGNPVKEACPKTCGLCPEAQQLTPEPAAKPSPEPERVLPPAAPIKGEPPVYCCIAQAQWWREDGSTKPKEDKKGEKPPPQKNNDKNAFLQAKKGLDDTLKQLKLK